MALLKIHTIFLASDIQYLWVLKLQYEILHNLRISYVLSSPRVHFLRIYARLLEAFV